MAEACRALVAVQVAQWLVVLSPVVEEEAAAERAVPPDGDVSQSWRARQVLGCCSSPDSCLAGTGGTCEGCAVGVVAPTVGDGALDARVQSVAHGLRR